MRNGDDFEQSNKPAPALPGPSEKPTPSEKPALALPRQPQKPAPALLGPSEKPEPAPPGQRKKPAPVPALTGQPKKPAPVPALTGQPKKPAPALPKQLKKPEPASPGQPKKPTPALPKQLKKPEPASPGQPKKPEPVPPRPREKPAPSLPGPSEEPAPAPPRQPKKPAPGPPKKPASAPKQRKKPEPVPALTGQPKKPTPAPIGPSEKPATGQPKKPAPAPPKQPKKPAPVPPRPREKPAPSLPGQPKKSAPAPPGPSEEPAPAPPRQPKKPAPGPLRQRKKPATVPLRQREEPAPALPRPSEKPAPLPPEQLEFSYGDFTTWRREVKERADDLNTNLETGIPGDDADLLQRKNKYGSNTYPQIKTKRFWMFLWEAWQDRTLIILMVAAVASLVLGIKTQGIKQGWYDGASIVFAVTIVIVVRAVSDFKQSLQFQNLNKEKRNIHLEVIRGGRRGEVSIDDIVVGDIVPINIGDQVPADGVIITDYSLTIDESSMVGASKVNKNFDDPFLMFGCKVADGKGTMLVTSVGINTKWGLLAKISEDIGEETLLQVRLNRVATLIGIVGLTMATGVMVVLLARFFSGHTKNTNGTVQFKSNKTSINEAVNGAIRIFTVAVTIVVVAMPGGLLLAVTLILAYLKRKMMADKALDPRLPGVKDAVQLCQQAGVKVRMVTGDNVRTAQAIALECGILHEKAVESNIIEGKVFRSFSDQQREENAENILVMARSSLNDKLLFVEALKKKGQVVAVTGRGANDTAALHLANIGLSMGIQSTQVAKESSNIIILDAEFASVVKVVRWGRSMYANIQEFIEFQLTVIVVGLIINVVTAISSSDVPLNAVQLPWVNLIMEALGALVLITKPPTDHLMHRSPVGCREPLITNIMWRNLFVQVVYQVTVLLVVNFQGKSLLDLNHDDPGHANKVKNTLMCNVFVLCQIFKEFARKSDEKNIFKGVTNNPLFIGYVAVMLVLQVIIIEFLGKFTSAVRLSWKLWLVSIVISFVSWPLAYIGEQIPMPEIPILEFLAGKSRQQGNSLGNLNNV